MQDLWIYKTWIWFKTRLKLTLLPQWRQKKFQSILIKLFLARVGWINGEKSFKSTRKVFLWDHPVNYCNWLLRIFKKETMNRRVKKRHKTLMDRSLWRCWQDITTPWQIKAPSLKQLSVKLRSIVLMDISRSLELCR